MTNKISIYIVLNGDDGRNPAEVQNLKETEEKLYSARGLRTIGGGEVPAPQQYFITVKTYRVFAALTSFFLGVLC